MFVVIIIFLQKLQVRAPTSEPWRAVSCATSRGGWWATGRRAGCAATAGGRCARCGCATCSACAACPSAAPTTAASCAPAAGCSTGATTNQSILLPPLPSPCRAPFFSLVVVYRRPGHWSEENFDSGDCLVACLGLVCRPILVPFCETRDSSLSFKGFCLLLVQLLEHI